jgi:isopenicillin-N epimerase
MEQDRRDFLKSFGKITAGIGLTSFAGGFPFSTGEGAAVSVSHDRGFWEIVRKQFFSLSHDSIYMNNSTFGPTLKPVERRMREVQNIFSKGCHLDAFVSEVLVHVSPMREKFRQLVNGYDDGSMKGRYIGNVDSVTEGMSLVANGITFRSGDTILITDHEHTGGRTMWELQQDRSGAQLIEIPLVIDGESEEVWKENLLNRFETALNQYRVKVMSFSWVTTSTGHVLPAKELCALARQKGAISVIDAAQAFAVLPIDVIDLDCDYFVVNGHKYLCGPIGSGFVVVHPRQLENLSSFWPTVVDENYYHPEDPARHSPHRKGGVAPLYQPPSPLRSLNLL